ncbi:adenylate/guanylate cyclase domain-containing protein [Rhizobium sp. BK538]|uniref:adenylate/guanylate cyclase domain-containing protein n=1 Tax=Rhizobium sp. BK538 TaxID=2586984 RepID=UPI0017CECAC9|nr:adenylate/guanylate cyclase domain-containing protein [Rhizobium sp. BK538]MBB4169749.1 adenylate cyclase [Rhizobium sp. BK538]
MTWMRGQPDASVQTIAHDVEATDVFLRSPFRVAIDSGKRVRQKLQINGPHIFAIYEELKHDGHTDYVAWPLDHTQGRRHLITFATDRPDGFSDQELALLDTLMPWYSLVTEVRVKDQLARTLLETYVGAHASDEILHGAITRGSRETIIAAILICDLRNFTRLSDSLPRDELIEILNRYFDVVAEPIERHGGEILKFIGDGLLAVFPMDGTDACQHLLAAVQEGYQSASCLRRTAELVRFGTGIHLGEVMYGNIGSKKRLDFTVIGSAVNLAFKLEALTKTLDRPVLLSGDFVQAAACFDQTDYLGPQRVSGFDVPIGVHALRLNASQMPC